MGVNNIREWECDRCNCRDKSKVTESLPGWSQFRWNAEVPLGSLDSDHWVYMLLCPACTKGIVNQISPRSDKEF